MRRIVILFATLGAAAAVFFLWRASARPDEVGSLRSDAGAQVMEAEAPLAHDETLRSPAGEALHEASDPLPAAIDGARALDERGWSFRWRLIGPAGEPISLLRLQAGGVSYHDLRVRHAAHGGEVHADSPPMQDPWLPLEGTIAVVDGDPPGWIELSVGDHLVRAEAVHAGEVVALVLDLPESSELGHARFVGRGRDGAPLVIHQLVAEAKADGALHSLLPQQVEGADGEPDLLWSLSAAPGRYTCTAAADPRFAGQVPEFALAHQRFELTAGAELEVELVFDRARTLRGTVAPAPGEGVESSLRLLEMGSAATAMANQPATIGSDGRFELSGLPPSAAEVAVLIGDSVRAEVCMYVFAIGADDDEVTLALDAALVPASYRLVAGTDRLVYARIENARGLVLFQGPCPTGLLLRLPEGEHRFFAAPMQRTRQSAGADLRAEVEARVSPPGPGGVREVHFDLPE